VSKITNDGLTRSGTSCFIRQQWSSMLFVCSAYLSSSSRPLCWNSYASMSTARTSALQVTSCIQFWSALSDRFLLPRHHFDVMQSINGIIDRRIRRHAARTPYRIDLNILLLFSVVGPLLQYFSVHSC